MGRLAKRVPKRHTSKRGNLGVLTEYALAAELESLEGEREKRYQAARKGRVQAEAAVGSRDEFLAIAAHELRTPITILKTSAQILLRAAQQRDASPHEQESLVGMIRQTDRITRLIRDLLDIARLESGQLQLRRKKIVVKVLVERVVDHMRQLAGRRKISFRVPRELDLEADPDRLGQVLTNLLSNAINHSPRESTITITVTTDKKKVRFSVQDQGVGIPKDLQPRVFERRFQVGPGKSGSLGLGLYVAKEIIERHGGKIWLESARGKGSTFFFTLPRTTPSP